MIVKLDLKDKKLLEQLDLNSRQSKSQIAKKIHLSKDAVAYRIRNLEKKKTILGYYTLLNISKLGFITYKLMLTFQNTPAEIEKEIVEYLKKNPHIGWLTSCDGTYNLMAVAWVKNAIVFDNFFTDFLKKYSQYLKERDIIVISENHACRKAYLYDKKIDETPDTYYGGEPELWVKDKDLDIVRFIANNAKLPLYKMAEKFKLTAEAIAHKIKQLQKKNIIQAFRPIINTPLLGYQYYNVFFRLKKFDNIKQIFSFFKIQPNIIYFVKYLGSYDIGIDLEVKDAEALRNVLNNIKERFNQDIESYNSVLIYQEHKLSYFPE